MKRAYQYLIYRVYTHFLKTSPDTPIGGTIIGISITMMINIITLAIIVMRIFPYLYIYFKNENSILYLLGFAALLMLFNYYAMYNKDKWNLYIQKFESESKGKRNIGTFFVFLYFIGSAIAFFAIAFLLIIRETAT